jgi:hypothetical protein
MKCKSILSGAVLAALVSVIGYASGTCFVIRNLPCVVQGQGCAVVGVGSGTIAANGPNVKKAVSGYPGRTSYVLGPPAQACPYICNVNAGGGSIIPVAQETSFDTPTLTNSNCNSF